MKVTVPVFWLFWMLPTGRMGSHTYPISCERRSAGVRGQMTKTCGAASDVARLRRSAPWGSWMSFQLHSRIGVACKLTETLRAIVE